MPNRKNDLDKMVSELPTNREKFVKCTGEFIGTGMLLLFGCMSCVPITTPPASGFQISMSFGLVISFIIMTFGHISGAHLNPVVTLSAALYGAFPILMVPLYTLAQIAGGIVGYYLLMLITPLAYAQNQNLCVTIPNSDLTPFQALMVEFLISSVLIIVFCSVLDHRNANKQDSLPLKFGLVITVLAMVAGPYTGASMNPARSLAPAIFQNEWKLHWVYWIGPTLASIIVTIFYRFIFNEPKRKDEDYVVEDIPLTNRSKV